ncbi:MAG: hypothetical protein R3E58_05480 [Phycisphaerae bacterium]
MLVIAMVLMYRACPNGSIRPTRAGIWEQLKYATPLGFTRVFGVNWISPATPHRDLLSPERFAIYDAAVEIPFSWRGYAVHHPSLVPRSDCTVS